MLLNDDQPGWLERILLRFPEGGFLRFLLAGMITATVVVVAIDYSELSANAPGEWPGARRLAPMPMEPPSQTDQLRPYLPRTNPVTRDGAPPKLPGINRGDEVELVQKSLTFHRGPDGAATAIGRIEPGAAGELERFLLAQGDEIKSLTLHSPGGSVRDAIAMAVVIRKAGLETAVPDNGYCASSCPLAFAAGTERTAGRKAWVGVHQIYTDAGTVGTIHDGLAEAQRISAQCQQHLVEMGVDPRVWVHAMRTPKQSLYLFTPEQLTELKLATRLVPAQVEASTN